jgi:hypothetical protein
MSDDSNELRPTPSPDDQLRVKPPKGETSGVAMRAVLGLLAYGVCFLYPRFSRFFALVLVLYSIQLARTRKYPGFALGVFIGVGLTLLVVGACFVMIATSHL